MFAGRPPCSLGFKPFEGSSTTEGSEGESNSLLPSVFIQSKIAEMITFYDIKNKDNDSWSPNTLKTELLLSHMGLTKDDFKLEWISYPEIRPLLESKGVQAAGTGDSTSEFTLPAIEHDGNVVMDSFAIAKYLEKAFPDRPPVFFAQSQALCVLLTNQLMTHIGRVLFPLLLPRIVALLDDKGADYFRRTREAKFKLTIMEDINKDTERVQKTWESVKQPLSVINDMLKQNTEGPYFYGRTRSYADCILLAFLKWWKRCGEKDFFDKVLELAPEFRKVWEASSDILSLP